MSTASVEHILLVSLLCSTYTTISNIILSLKATMFCKMSISSCLWRGFELTSVLRNQPFVFAFWSILRYVGLQEIMIIL